MILINDLKINDLHYKFCEEGKYSEKTYLNNLSKINIFIGANNSGKSRLLRHFFNSEVKFMRKYENIYNSEDLKELCKESCEHLLENRISNFDEIRKIFNIFKSNLEKKEKNKERIFENLGQIIVENNKIKQKNKDGDNDKSYHGDKINKKVSLTVQRLNTIIDNYFSGIIGTTNEDGIIKYKFKRIYIPILRGLRHLSDENKDFYHDRTNKDYFDSKSDGIYSGLNYYDLLREHLLGDLKQRDLINDYQKYLSETFFDGNEVTLIPREKDDEEKNRIVWVKIGNEKEKPIYELGDGIQTIIIITLPLFLNLKNFEKDMSDNRNVLVFIEEPEQHLHPRLQKKLIKTFLDERFENYQFFFTTHSNHFLDSVLQHEKDISVFSFKKKLENESSEEEPTFCINRVSADNSSIFEDLGVLPSSVFITNCNIVVEGTTDKLYYRKYLDLYQESNKTKKDFKFFKEENYDYNFIISCGSEIKSLLEDLNDRQKEKMFFIVDKDDSSEDKEQMFKENNCKNYITKCRAAENLLSKDVINKIIDDHEDAKEIKDRNDFSEKDYQEEKLAEFIDKTILKCETSIFANKNGNFDKKVKFAQKALKHIKSLDDLSEEAKKISENIHKFIKSKNSI